MDVRRTGAGETGRLSIRPSETLALKAVYRCRREIFGPGYAGRTLRGVFSAGDSGAGGSLAGWADTPSSRTPARKLRSTWHSESQRIDVIAMQPRKLRAISTPGWIHRRSSVISLLSSSFCPDSSGPWPDVES